MKEKKKFSWLTLFLILAIITIVIMGYYIYEMYNIKLVKEDNIIKLNEEISGLKSEISRLNGKEENNNLPVNTKFFGVYTSDDKQYKYVFLPNGEMCHINNRNIKPELLRNRIETGTYEIKTDNSIYFSISPIYEWFDGSASCFGFEIIDRNTLKFSNFTYTRYVEEKLNGIYNTSDGSLIFDENGNFELRSYGEETLKGSYVINGDVLELNFDDKNKENEEYLIFDKDLIVAQWEADGKVYYQGYVKYLEN